MKKSLSEKKGLSISQAQSISNLCYQESLNIQHKLDLINNCSKIIKHNGDDLIQVKGYKIPDNVIELLERKAMLHGVQAFLVENIKAKEELLTEIRNSSYKYSEQECKYPNLQHPNLLPKVDEKYGWDSLTTSEYNEYLEVEAKASHLGQFIHSKGKLDNLRKELTKIPSLEWIEIKKDEKTPVEIKIHHEDDELLTLHNKIASKHKEFESRVNYFKAKVKNITSDRNAEIAKLNANEISRVTLENNILIEEYSKLKKDYDDYNFVEKEKFESEKEGKIKSISKLKIEVDDRFKPIIDEFNTVE